MNCNKCNSDNTQRLEVVYENGTQNINTKSGSTGIGFGRGGVSLGFGKTKTKGTALSTSAIKASPPAKKKIKWFLLMIFIGLMLISDKHAGTQALVGGGIVLALGGFFLYKNVMFNIKVLPQLHKIWLDSWMCNKCGSIFHVEAN